MWYAAGACVVLIIPAVAGYARIRPGAGSKSITSLDALTSSTIAEIMPESLMSLSVEQVNFLLSRLEKEEPPQSTMGAMCYQAMAPPATAEYICPVCGEKTLYSDSQTAFIEWELEGCRRLAESINSNTDFEIFLDEGLFCDYCSPDTGEENPEILLRVIYESDMEVVNRVSVIDLMMLDSFLQGNLFYTTSNDAQMPMQNYAGRMRELLGLEEE